MIPYGRQSISQADIDAVTAVLKSDFLTQGPAVPRFERRVADHVRAAHGVAVCNATAALHLACLALGVGPGDRVWTSPLTFVASANCVLYCGASVDFVDVDHATYNMSADALADKLAQAEAEGTLPKVVIPVHLSGQSCAMEPIRRLADRYGFAIVEDASHAIGATYQGRPVGDCRFSDICVFSFHPVKIITTGEGGMAVTNDPDLAERLRLLRSHGITRDPARMESAPDGGWYYEQIELGFNYRMTDLQAALGVSQMDRLDSFVEKRCALAARYDAAFAHLPLVRPWQDPDTGSSFHLYVIRIGREFDHRAAYDALWRDGIGASLHYIPVYLQPYYRKLGFASGHCAEAEAYYAEAISLPLYAGLSEADQDHVITAVTRITRG